MVGAAQAAPVDQSGGTAPIAAGFDDSSALEASAHPSLDAFAPTTLDDEYDNRERVDETAEVFHFSAVGSIHANTPYEGHDKPEEVGPTRTGVLVSPHHVLTAAHTVADDDGNAEVDEDWWFAPGTTEIDGETTLYHGRAKVETIRIDPEYDGGDDNADDIALLTLDRPIGYEAGQYDLAAIDETDAWDDDFYYLGYPGDNQLRQGYADGYPYAEYTRDSHVVAAEFDQGDSGGPLFKNPGDPAVHSVISGFWRADLPGTDIGTDVVYFAAPITADREAMLRNWIDADDVPISKPELYRADRVEWVDDGTHTTPDEITPTEAGEFATTLYNGGHKETAATVEFYLVHEHFSLTEAPEHEPVCRDTIILSGADVETASCSGTTPAHVSEEDSFDVYPVFDATHGEHATTEERDYYRWGETTLAVPGAKSDPELTNVQAPRVVEPDGEEFDVTATVANDGTTQHDVTLQFGTDDQIDGEPYETTVTVPPEDQVEYTVSFPGVSEEFAGESIPLTVFAGDDSTTVDITIASVEGPLLRLQRLEASDGAVGEPYEFDVDVYNDGTSGPGTLSADLYGPNGNQHLQHVNEYTVDEVDPNLHQTVSFEVMPEPVVAGDATIVVTADPGERISTDVAFDYDAPDPTVEITSAPDRIEPGTSILPVEAAVSNPGAIETTTEVALEIDGEIAIRETVDLSGDSTEYTSLETPVTTDAGEELDVVVSTDAGTDDRHTVEVADRVDVQVESVPELIEASAPVETNVTVTNEGVDLATVDVELALDDVVVDEYSITVAANSERTITVEGQVPEEHSLGPTMLAVETRTDRSSAETQIVADCAEVSRQAVCDLDGDGNYRDLTASGDVTSQDLQTFFAHQHLPEWDSRPELFDFTDNGEVGQPDVVDLFHAI